MAEGIESLANPEDLELARKASEQMGDIEMQMEYDKELPPALRAGERYSLFSDLGRSVPNLQYHTFGTVPERFREEFRATRPAREAAMRMSRDFGDLDYTKSINLTDTMLGYPRHESPRGGTLTGLYTRPVPADVQEKMQKVSEKYGMRPPYTFQKGYGKPEDSAILFGGGLASLPEARFSTYGLKEGEAAPGFLTGPTRPSISVKLSELLVGEPVYRKSRANTFQHELVHAGASHPRFLEFFETPFFKTLPVSTQLKFKSLRDINHFYIDDMDRYKKEYQKAVKDGTVEKTLREDVALLPQALEKIKADSDAGKIDEDFERRTFTLQRMIQDIEQGDDPVDTYVKGIVLTGPERRNLSDLEEISLIFGSFLNRTADPERGRQSYTSVEALKQAAPFGLLPERFMPTELTDLDLPVETSK